MLAITPLGEWLDYWRLRAPSREALIEADTGARWNYQQLADACDRLTGALRAERVAAGDRVALLARNRVETILLLFACARLRAVLVPLNTRLTAAELTGLLQDAEPCLLLHDDTQAATIPRLQHACPAKPLTDLQALAGSPAPLSQTDPEQPVLMLYTSGTTGKPKGALLSQRMVCWNAINTSISWDLSGADSTIIHTPFFHTGGLHVLTTPLLLRGGRLVLLPVFDPEQVLHWLETARISTLFAVPTMFQRLLDSPAFADTDLSHLRFCISGGAPCPVELIERYQARGVVFIQGYGLTEAGPNCFTLPAHDALAKQGSVGFANFATRAQVVDEAGHPVPVGSVGELWLAGPTLCSGYWRNPSATRQLFQDGWLKTGDLVRQDAEGYTWIVDRKKDMYISGGENVYPAEIEAVLLQFPAIAEAAVVARPDAEWGEVGVAHLVLKPGQVWDEAALRAFLQTRLARFKQPKTYCIETMLPRTTTGKIQKNQLKEI
ncbi:fatty-acyl-CoA synthase [Chitinivorax tropicus]|uniref:Fatty-acyl-CoA synthase n=1 Tax=Chitinivorax tropicus TaxID=714531 RepID=A0A840MP55_9PROT|nr:long-chain fatty acid--CoA ligase [Chitinivorax tropicus]MBB5019245.1 fatty-acyl-CoA synthase [Chitinivorax tropicus]